MGLGFGFSALLLPSALILAPATPSFAEGWYREVVLGDLAGAGEVYVRLYEDAGSAARAPASPVVRRRAALRAGGSFEKLGDLRRAQAAYAWLERAGPLEDPLVRAARLRLLSIGDPVPPSAAPAAGAVAVAVPSRVETGPPRGETGPAAAPLAGPKAVPGTPVLERLESRVARREACLAELRLDARRREEQIREERRLRARMAELGVEMRFAEDSNPLPGTALDDLEHGLEPEDRDLLLAELAERYYLRGLRALVGRDPAAAVRELRKTLWARRDYRDASDLLHLAQGALAPLDGVAERAAMRLRDRQEAGPADGRRKLQSSLAAAERLALEGRGPAALAELESGRSLVEWAPPAVARAPELRALAQEIDTRALALDVSARPVVAAGAAPEALRQPREASRVVERYEELRLRGRRTAEEVVRAAEELIDFKWASTERGRPLLLADPAEASPAGPSSAGETGGAAARIGDELERLLLRGEEKRSSRPEDQGPDGWRGEFLDILILLRWFPDLDADQRYRKLAQDYLGR